MLEGTVWHNTQMQQQRYAASKPCITLLRQKHTIPAHPSRFGHHKQIYTIAQVVHKRGGRRLVHIPTCMRIARLNSVDPQLSTACIITEDAMRWHTSAYSTTSSDEFIPWRQLSWCDSASVLHLPCLQSEIMNMAFCTPMQQKNTLVYLFSKTINQRCMRRKFGSVSLRKFSKDAEACDIMTLILLLHLLGNYEHSIADSRPTAEVRAKLFDRLLDNRGTDANKQWFLTLVQHCEHFIEFAVRDYICCCINNQPPLRAHLQTLFNVEQFQQVVEKAARANRLRFAAHMRCDTPILEMCKDLSAALTPFHNAYLAINYRLPENKAGVLAMLYSFRSVLPVVDTLDNNGHHKSSCDASACANDMYDDEDDDEEDDCDEENEFVDRLIHSQMAPSGCSNLQQTISNIASDLAQKRMSEDTGTDNHSEDNPGRRKMHDNYPLLKHAVTLIGVDAFQRLDGWATVIGPTRLDALRCIVALFPLLHVDARITRQLVSVVEAVRCGSMVKQAIEQLRWIRQTHPLAYNLLQITVDLIKYHSRVSLVCKLPAQIIQGQIQAVQAQFKQLPNTHVAIFDAFDFAWCRVCNALYSMVREFRSNYKTVYAFGYRDAVVDYETDRAYCWRSKTTHAGCCKDIPLVRMPLFGLVYKHAGRYIMLCTECAGPMALDTGQCAYGAHGPMCVKCTAVFKEERDQSAAVLASLEREVHVCLWCNRGMKSAESVFCYGPGTYLCSRHHHKRYAHALASVQLQLGRKLSAGQCAALLLQLLTEAKHRKVEYNQARWKREVAYSKLMRSSKR